MLDIKRYGEWILVFVTILAALGWVFSKEAIASMPPFGFIGLRFICAAIILLPVCFSAHQTIKIEYLPKAIFAASLQFLNIIFWILAIYSGGALGEGAFIMSLSILLVPLIAWVLFKDKPLNIFWVSLPIAIIGLAFLTLVDGWHTSINQIWFFLSALAAAVFFNFNSRFVQNIAVLPLTFIQLLFVGLCSLVLSLFFDSWSKSISWDIWSWFIASVLLATTLRYVLQLVGQKYVSVGNAAIIMILEPVFTTLLGKIVYYEEMAWNKWLGCGLILLSLLIYRGYVFIRTRHQKPLSV